MAESAVSAGQPGYSAGETLNAGLFGTPVESIEVSTIEAGCSEIEQEKRLDVGQNELRAALPG